MSLHVVLVEPEIPWNTGNIGRTCVAVGARLHLIGKLGFEISSKQIRRSGLDYWPKLKWKRHESFETFLVDEKPASLLLFSTKAKKIFWNAPYEKESYLVFGKETAGLPAALRTRYKDRLYKIPLRAEARSLNLSTAAAVVLYEAVRRTTNP